MTTTTVATMTTITTARALELHAGIEAGFEAGALEVDVSSESDVGAASLVEAVVVVSPELESGAGDSCKMRPEEELLLGGSPDPVPLRFGAAQGSMSSKIKTFGKEGFWFLSTKAPSGNSKVAWQRIVVTFPQKLSSS